MVGHVLSVDECVCSLGKGEGGCVCECTHAGEGGIGSVVGVLSCDEYGHFRGRSIRPDLSFRPMDINFACKALLKLAIFLYGRFEFEDVGDKWMHETHKEEEECRKPRKQTPT